MLSMDMKLCNLVLLLSGVAPLTAVEAIPLAQLTPRVGTPSRIDVRFADGTSLATHLLGAKLANGGTVRMAGWPTKVAACREIQTITYEESGRGLGRGALGVAIGIGTAIGTIRLMGKLPGPTSQGGPLLLLGAPFAGLYGARRLVPRRPQTLSLICP